MRVLKWCLYILLAAVLGVLLGLPAGFQLGKNRRLEAQASARGLPLVHLSDHDYRAANGVVSEFAQWGEGGLARSFEERYPPPEITPNLQRSFYNSVVQLAMKQDEIDVVIDSTAEHAIVEANREQAQAALSAGVSHPMASTLIIYAEKAEYYGQDAWCFLTLSTADQRTGTARVIVQSCTPSYGLVHIQAVGAF